MYSVFMLATSSHFIYKKRNANYLIYLGMSNRLVSWKLHYIFTQRDRSDCKSIAVYIHLELSVSS